MPRNSPEEQVYGSTTRLVRSALNQHFANLPASRSVCLHSSASSQHNPRHHPPTRRPFCLPSIPSHMRIQGGHFGLLPTDRPLSVGFMGHHKTLPKKSCRPQLDLLGLPTLGQDDFMLRPGSRCQVPSVLTLRTTSVDRDNFSCLYKPTEGHFMGVSTSAVFGYYLESWRDCEIFFMKNSIQDPGWKL